MSTLGDRMKGYESVSASRLIPKAPVRAGTYRGDL